MLLLPSLNILQLLVLILDTISKIIPLAISFLLYFPHIFLYSSLSFFLFLQLKALTYCYILLSLLFPFLLLFSLVSIHDGLTLLSSSSYISSFCLLLDPLFLFETSPLLLS